MMDMKKIWTVRRNAYFTESLRYFQLMASSGLIVSMFLLIVIGSIYYARLIKVLPEDFPAELLLTAVFTYWLTRSPVRTLLKKADLVFLLPVESRMKNYFSHALTYSLAIQLFNTLLLFTLFWPLIQAFIRGDTLGYVWFASFLLISKLFNLYVSWEEQRLPFARQRKGYMMLRGAVNAVYVFLLFQEASFVFLAAILAIMYVLKSFVFGYFKKMHGYQWEHLLRKEHEMQMKVYRVANLFTDVPALQQTMSPRRWLNWLTAGKYMPSKALERLYMRTFLRANDYCALYIRLVLIGWLFIYIIPNGWWQTAVVLLFMQMTALQLCSILVHHKRNAMFELYPISWNKKVKSFASWLGVITIIQSILFALFYYIEANDALIAVMIAATGALYAKLYVPIIVNKQTNHL
ncbi:ABC transporter permease [Fictibacillus iocasae]|uniref:ABC transporter permease n=1 Tax=Fictibacillus iocasae TaxID=2715437 RepID=A0ABW2NXU9_9BACL